MDKKRKDAVIRATVDRAALLRGVLMLTALALLLCFGLKPSRAAAPDAEDGALTASDASARLSAECELLQRVTFSPCGHEMTRRQRLPAELAGMTKDELAAKYDQWVITSFSLQHVLLPRVVRCGVHHVHAGLVDGNRVERRHDANVRHAGVFRHFAAVAVHRQVLHHVDVNGLAREALGDGGSRVRH